MAKTATIPSAIDKRVMWSPNVRKLPRPRNLQIKHLPEFHALMERIWSLIQAGDTLAAATAHSANG